MKLMQEDDVSMLLTPSNTPEFSPIENMFGYIKKKLQDLEFFNKEHVAKVISKQMFSLNPLIISGFFKKTLSNMSKFWMKIDRSKLIENL